ncbi:MAG: glycosyltransferase family 4 protein [Spartobacteria bacterium]|nr:glycosyltransferase family 4 protein [Spartobacteria bacterium]
MQTVLAHDWLTGMRGGERVLEILCRAFADAPIYTLLSKPEALSPDIRRHPIHTSPLQRIPGIHRNYRYFLPFFPSAIESLDVPEADLLISTSHCVAKGIKSRPGMRHLCYCFTPVRYAWFLYDDYFGGNPLKKMLLEPFLKRLRKWDHRVSARVTHFTAISHHVQRRIENCYGREADVVYPPVNTDMFTPGDAEPGDFDLIVSALVPYKRVDLAVRAYSQMKRRLKIVGTGTEYETLQCMATPNIEFLGWQPDEAILALYRSCRCLIFPGEEDFGIVPVEAQACGRPVVAYARGGALETVVEGISGVFFEEQNEDSLREAVEECDRHSWNPAAIRKNAEQFSEQKFIDGFAKSIRQCLTDHHRS